MANKVTFNFKDEIAALEKTVKKKFMSELGEFVAEQIRLITRGGQQLKHKRSSRNSHPELTEFTKKKRAELARDNNTNEHYSSETSNLTFTGQLLDAITHDVMERGKIKVSVKNTIRKPVVDKTKKKQKTLTNAQVQADLEKRGRDFLAIDKELEIQIANKVTRFINRRLSKIRKG